jgi:predicted XRE-type DNA-binding protein
MWRRRAREGSVSVAKRDVALAKETAGNCSMKKSKIVMTRTAAGLAKALGLGATGGAEMELRSDLNSKIAEVVAKKGLTHAQVARLAGTSRTRVTAIMNRNTKDVSTDLLLRVLYAVGYVAKIRFERAA